MRQTGSPEGVACMYRNEANDSRIEHSTVPIGRYHSAIATTIERV